MAEESPRVDAAPPLCPSAPAGLPGAVVFGVVGGEPEAPRVGSPAETPPATPAVLALVRPADPGEVFRLAAPCAGGACRHFDGERCRLAGRVVALLPVVVAGLPPCRLRPRCRWWQQEGRAACLRCPQVATAVPDPPAALRQVAGEASEA